MHTQYYSLYDAKLDGISTAEQHDVYMCECAGYMSIALALCLIYVARTEMNVSAGLQT